MSIGAAHGCRVAVLVVGIVAQAGCTFIYYRDKIPIRPPAEHAWASAASVAELMNGTAEPNAGDLAAALVREEHGEAGVSRLAAAVEGLERGLEAALGRQAAYRELFAQLYRLLLAAGREAVADAPVAPYDVLAAAEGRNRNCVALSLLYLLVAEDLGVRVHMVLTRNHTLLMYDDGLVRDFHETTGGYFYTPQRLRAGFFGAHPVPDWCLRPLSMREAAAVVLSNRALVRAHHSPPAALADLALAAQLFAGLPQTHVNRGYLLEQQGRSDDARACYERALELDADNPYALNNLASLLMRQGNKEDLEEAAQYARRAVALLPRERAFMVTLRMVERALEEAGR